MFIERASLRPLLRADKVVPANLQNQLANWVDEYPVPEFVTSSLGIHRHQIWRQCPSTVITLKLHGGS